MGHPVSGAGEDQRGTRAARRRARMREEMLDVAERAFTASGYRDVRMEDIAEAVDVSVGTLYGHFGSKDGLYLALGERALDGFATYLEEAYQPDYTPLEQVMACGDLYLRFHLEHPGLFRFLAFDGVEAQLARTDDDLYDRVGRRVGEILATFEEHIAAAIASGEADAAYDPKIIARFLWGAWNGVVAMSRRHDAMALTDAEVSACIQMGRQVVNNGLASAAFRDDLGHSRARLVDTGQRTSRRSIAG